MICRKLLQVLYFLNQSVTSNTFYKEERTNTHTQNIIPRFNICIFFHHNDTVVDAQIFKIFGHHQSILDVFLNQHTLKCSSPTCIFICKFCENISNTQKLLSFWGSNLNKAIFEHLLFCQLHYATWIGNSKKWRII